ncbi:MAG: site-specific integrase [Acidimicrobiales bacterium]|nr:site-specific integrase [Acidimicrobiales bacterium]
MASVDKRPNGKWRARWREYPGGPQKTKAFDRKIDADRHIVEMQHRLSTGTYVAPEDAAVTLGAFAPVHLNRQPWRPTTRAVVDKSFVHILAAFKDRPLGTIRKGDIQAFVSGLQLAPSTVGLVFQHLNAMLEAATDDGLIVRNPAKGVRLPRSTRNEVVPPTTAQVGALYEAAPKWFRPAVILGAGLGLRQAEASGLTVDRIDWLGRTVRVDRQWLSRQEVPAFAPPKTRSSDRTIPASTFVLNALSTFTDGPSGRHVIEHDGGPLGHDLFGHYWRQTREKAHVGAITFHDLRHAYASMLISAGCSVKAVSAALGHANAATTLNMYSHLWPGDEDRIRKAVDQALGEPAEDSVRIGEAAG